MAMNIGKGLLHSLPHPPRATFAPGSAGYTAAQERLDAIAELRRVWEAIDSPFTRAMLDAIRAQEIFWSRDITKQTVEEIGEELAEGFA